MIVKLEAYPLLRYGYLQGEVEHVSPDAVIDETRGLVFPARIRITQARFREIESASRIAGGAGQESTIAGQPLGDDAWREMLTPGLSAAVEIKTGKRSVLSYLLSPVARSVSEAGRER